MTTVQLVPYEYAMAYDVCGRRRISAMKDGRQDVAGMDSTTPEAYRADIEGVAAEIAVAKFLGLYWDGSVDTFHDKPDLSDFVEVKWSSKTNGLLIRPSSKEKSEHVFVLVTGQKGTYEIHGWRTRAWVEENIQPGGGDPSRPAPYICPIEQLESVESLKQMVAVRMVEQLIGADACVASKKAMDMLRTAASTLTFPARPVVSVRTAVFEKELPRPIPGKPTR